MLIAALGRRFPSPIRWLTGGWIGGLGERRSRAGERGLMALKIGKMPRPDAAFAAAVVFMAARAPFRTLPFGEMVEAIAGAVSRGQYALASENGRVVGVTLWAVTSAEIALRWTEDGYSPTYEETLEGDTVVLTMGAGQHPSVALQGVRHVARQYPGYPYRMVRHGRDGTRVGRFPTLRSSR